MMATWVTPARRSGIFASAIDLAQRGILKANPGMPTSFIHRPDAS